MSLSEKPKTGGTAVADVTVKDLDQFDVMSGRELSMRRVRAGLGVSSFGMQVIDLPPETEAYSEHDHSDSGQEEVYTVLDGAASLKVGGEEYELRPGVFARVGPDEKRKLVTGAQPARLLALGGIPAAPYEPPEWTEETEQASST